MYLQVYVPAWMWGLILVSMLVLLANAGMHVFDGWFTRKRYKADNEVTGIVFNVLSLIYSLIITFVIVAVWQNYDDLNRTIEEESDHLNSVLIHSNLLPDSLQTPVTNAIIGYCEKVINVEWQMQGNIERRRGSAIPSLRLMLYQAEENKTISSSVLSMMETDLINITRLHSERLSHTRAYVPELVWMVLVAGSVMVIAFSYFLTVESKSLRRIYLSFLWTLMGMSLFLIYMLDHPFIGSTQVSKAPYEAILKLPQN